MGRIGLRGGCCIVCFGRGMKGIIGIGGGGMRLVCSIYLCPGIGNASWGVYLGKGKTR